MKYLFVIARYSDYRQEIFDTIISPRNKEFAEKHGYKYVEILNEHNIELFRGNPTWWKYTVIQDLLIDGKLQDGDYIVNIDADQMFVNIENDIPNEKSFSYAIDSCNSHCNSLLSFKINEWTRKFISNLLDDKLWNDLQFKNSTHEGFTGKFDSFALEFREQAMMYALFGIKRHSNTSFWEYPDNGWHSDVTDKCIYSLEELREHVTVLPSNWNVTAFEGEHEGLFFLNKVKRDEVITRHFAGGQNWHWAKNWL